VLELRRGFGPGIITALARLDGRAIGMVANDPSHLGGAIDADGADKASRFMQLCDAFGLPLVFLADTPGFMVGPDAERTATVRHFSRMFVTGANLSVPTGTVVMRKAYGLGAQAMAAGGFKFPLFTIGWPTSEFGAMGLEGAVRLGMRRELEAIEDPAEREQAYQTMVSSAYERGRGISMASYFEIDDVIDPVDTRRWIATLFDDTAPGWWQTAAKRRPNVDTW
jgi:acetyl-CoA carboxylase carboxyltransferase component